MKKIFLLIFLFFGLVNTSWGFTLSGTTYDNISLTVPSSGYNNSPGGIGRWSTNGDKFFLSRYIYPGGANIYYYLYQYSCTTAYLINTCTLQKTKTLSQNTNYERFDISSDGLHFIYGGGYYDMTTAWDIDTLVYKGSTGLGTLAGNGFRYSYEGNKFFTGNYGDGIIRQYILSTPFSMSGATLSGTFNTGLGNSSIRGMWISPTGTDLIITTRINGTRHYILSTPNDITTAILSSTYNGTAFDFMMNNDGSKIYFDNNSTIAQYSTNSTYPGFTPTINATWGGCVPKSDGIIYYIYWFYVNGILTDGFSVSGNSRLRFGITGSGQTETLTTEYSFGFDSQQVIEYPYFPTTAYNPYVITPYLQMLTGSYCLGYPGCKLDDLTCTFEAEYSYKKLSDVFGSGGFQVIQDHNNDVIGYDESIWDWDFDGDGSVGIGEFFRGIGSVIKYFFQKIIDFFGNIIKLLKKLGTITSPDIKTF